MFFINLENLLIDVSGRNPHAMLLIGDFNTKLKT